MLVLTQAACDPGGSPRDQAGAHPTSTNPTSADPRANPTSGCEAPRRGSLAEPGEGCAPLSTVPASPKERGCAALPSIRTQLAQLAVLAGVLVALIAFEVVRYAEARAAVRAGEGHH